MTRKPRIRANLAPAAASIVKAALCQWVASGRSVSAFCAREGAPSHKTLIEWREADPRFAEAWAKAREIGCDSIAEQVLETTSPSYVERDGDGRVDTAHVQWIKTSADIRLRLLQSWSPRYGRVAVDTTVRAEPMSDAQRADEVRRLLAVAEQRALSAGEPTSPAEEPEQ